MHGNMNVKCVNTVRAHGP